VLAFSQIFVFRGTIDDLELAELSSSGGDILFIDLVALVPFLLAAYGVNFNYIPAAFKAILGDRRLAIIYVTILAVAIFHTFYHRDIRSILYNVLLLITIPAFTLFWKRFSNEITSVFTALSVSLLCYLATVPLVFGAPHLRYYGLIHPNAYGGVALSAAACIVLSEKKWLWLGQLVALAGAISIDSRFAILGILLIAGAQHTISAVAIRSRAWGVRLRVGLLAVLALYFASDMYDIFAVSDLHRGLGSGISGRSDLWQAGIEYIREDPLGYGFKNSYSFSSGHNGWLNLAIQFGLLPAIVIGSMFILQMLNMWNEFRAQHTNRHPGAHGTSQLEMNLLICFGALLAGGFFQPQMMNFGDSIGVLFLLIISRPGPPQKNVAHAGLRRRRMSYGVRRMSEPNPPLCDADIHASSASCSRVFRDIK